MARCVFARTGPQSSSNLFNGYARSTIHCGVGVISTATIIGTTEAPRFSERSAAHRARRLITRPVPSLHALPRLQSVS
jgi:hypothetical protein